MIMEIPDSCHVPWCSVSAFCMGKDHERLYHIHNLDNCVVKELYQLWGQGIETVCSCCGHGLDEKAFIRVKKASERQMLSLGYEPYEPHECPFHPGDPAFRAKGVADERAKGSPHDDRTIEEIRELWKKGVEHSV